MRSTPAEVADSGRTTCGHADACARNSYAGALGGRASRTPTRWGRPSRPRTAETPPRASARAGIEKKLGRAAVVGSRSSTSRACYRFGDYGSRRSSDLKEIIRARGARRSSGTSARSGQELRPAHAARKRSSGPRGGDSSPTGPSTTARTTPALEVGGAPSGARAGHNGAHGGRGGDTRGPTTPPPEKKRAVQIAEGAGPGRAEGDREVLAIKGVRRSAGRAACPRARTRRVAWFARRS